MYAIIHARISINKSASWDVVADLVTVSHAIVLNSRDSLVDVSVVHGQRVFVETEADVASDVSASDWHEYQQMPYVTVSETTLNLVRRRAYSGRRGCTRRRRCTSQWRGFAGRKRQ